MNTAMINRYKTQSISVSEEELQAIKDLAARLRMKPAALARDMFYRGMAAFLDDGLVHAQETDDVIFGRLRDWLDSDQVFRVPVYHRATVPHEPDRRYGELPPGSKEEDE